MDYSYDHILVRYGELSLKGKNKKDFIQRLKENTKEALFGFEKVTVEAGYDRMFVYLNGTDPQPVIEILSKVFGISSFSLAIRCQAELEVIKETVMGLLDFSSPKTFKVQARRHDKMFMPKSDQINREVATVILKNTDWKVDVRHPQVTILIEVRQEGAYIMTDRIKGAGGFPVGVGGKTMHLLSGGIDSPVAGMLMMKKGIRAECVHFAAPPYTSDQAKEKVLKLASDLAGWQGYINVHVVPFTTLQLAIYHYCPESYAITIMRRMMMRIASGLAEKRRCLCLSSGESLGQVASQTLDSLYVINACAGRPMIRPVACMDKTEIIDLARKIGTYETSIEPFEDCCTIFTPKSPVTRPKMDKCEAYEAKWDWQSMVRDCIDQAELIRIYPQTNQFEAEMEDLF